MYKKLAGFGRMRCEHHYLLAIILIVIIKLMGARQDGSLGITSLDEWSKRFNPENLLLKNWMLVLLKLI